MSFDVSPLTFIHVIVSLVGIVSGFIVAYGWATGKRHELLTAPFLITTLATSLTGFLFPIQRMTPALLFGIVSMISLPLAIYARYVRHESGRWRKAFIIASLFSLYLNVFAGVVQLFLKVPFFRELAPTQSEPPFAVAQLLVLATFIFLGVKAIKRPTLAQTEPHPSR
jgi:hypothetical protein